MSAPGQAYPHAVTDLPVHDIRETLGRLIRLATGPACSRSLVNAAWQALRRPLAVVDGNGASIASAPANGAADAAMRVAMTCAVGAGDPPSDWTVRRLDEEDRTVGWMAVHRSEVLSDDDEAVVEALSGLLAAQLGRAALRRSVTVERQVALRKRVIIDPGPDVAGVLADGEAIGVHFAPAYLPSVIVWGEGDLSGAALAEATQEWQAEAPPGSFLVVCDGTLALLYADWTLGTLLQRAVEMTVERTAAILSRQRPPLEARGVVGERSVPIERLYAHVRTLRQVGPYATLAAAGSRVHPLRHFAVDRVLEGVNASRAHSFVSQWIGPLLAYDDRQGSTLANTLALALEYPTLDDAARAAFMHRNTFRRHLQLALELIHADLEDPDQRLALHLALKLHRHLKMAAEPRRVIDAPRRAPRTRARPERQAPPRTGT